MKKEPNIYRKRPDKDNVAYLATDPHSPYFDNQEMVTARSITPTLF